MSPYSQLTEASAGLIALPFVVAAGRISAAVSILSGLSNFPVVQPVKKLRKKWSRRSSSLLMIFRHRDDRLPRHNLANQCVGALECRRLFTHTCVARESIFAAASQPFWKEVNAQKSKSPPVAGRAPAHSRESLVPWRHESQKSELVKWKPCFR